MTIQSHASDPTQSIAAAFHEDADHRIAKSLTMISGLVRLRAYKGDIVDPGSLLLEIADRIDTVAELHGLLSHSTSGMIQLSKYLQRVCELSIRATSPYRTSFSVSCLPEHLVPFGVAMPLGIITAELLSNSQKYAHPAGLPIKIEIACRRRRPDCLSLAYRDDGVGFPDGFDPLRDGKVGMHLVKSLSERLRARYAWSSDSLGMGFQIRIPMRASTGRIRSA
jgi:two-component sensor histidine kinase